MIQFLIHSFITSEISLTSHRSSNEIIPKCLTSDFMRHYTGTDRGKLTYHIQNSILLLINHVYSKPLITNDI